MDRAEKFDNHVDAVAGTLTDIARDLMVIGAEDAETGSLSPQILTVLIALNKAEKDVISLLNSARNLEAAEYDKATL
jgi:hypothetical protein